ncbi:MAG: adenylyl-sulfate kinase [Proteobacteria bacterium]|nr:adenylyl-sulfate kinase [Pseudomonadota bacterium]
MVIWVIGLSGAGKTTIGKALATLWKKTSPNTVFLDGDMIRYIIGDNLGHTLADRERNGWRVCRLCEHLDNEGLNVVCSVVSLFPEQRAWNRQKYSSYFEVYVKVPISELCNRDQKGIYSGFLEKKIVNVAGLDLPFNEPSADMVIENSEPFISPHQLAQNILEKAQSFALIK